MNNDNNDAKFIDVPNKIKSKVGSGGIDPKIVKGAQKVVEYYVKDFPPIAETELLKITNALEEFDAGKRTEDKTLSRIQGAAIDLKSNGAMFDYPIVSQMAKSLLNFSETINTLDKNSRQIILAHHRAMGMVIDHRDSKEIDKISKTLLAELVAAVSRYYKKEDIVEHRS